MFNTNALSIDRLLCVMSIHARLAFAMAGFVFFSALVSAAGLGEIQIRSALGEQFDATVSVSLLEGETLTDACFQVVESLADSGMHSLRNARASFRKLGQDGEVRILGVESEHEPLLKMALRLRCPEDGAHGMTREYNVLLDPRDSKFQPPLVIEPPTPPIATLAPLRQTPVPDRQVRVARGHNTPEQSLTPQNLRIATAAKPRRESSQERPPTKTSEQVEGEFKLKLSTSPLDPNVLNLNLSEEEKIELRERLLVNESDDQSAQMLLLKDKISHLEKRIIALQITQASPVAVPPRQVLVESKHNNNAAVWLWGGIALLLASMLGFLFWRWKMRSQVEKNFFSFDTDVNNPNSLVSDEGHLVVAENKPILRSASSVPQTGSDEWGASQMDVVSPGNVAEEAQLLLDHGLLRQAVDLLQHEIGLRPTALALWMKLFDAYRQAGDKKAFQSQAMAFQTYFVSETTWRQVQSIGREMDPSNPLYMVQEARSIEELAVEFIPDHEPSGNDDFDIMHLINAADTAAKAAKEEKPEVLHADLPLEFHLPEETAASDREEQSAEKLLIPLDAPMLAFPDEVPAERKPFVPRDFTSSDPVLQGLARMIFTGGREDACLQLEELLYKGTFEQRLVATKWLDKLLPVQDK